MCCTEFSKVSITNGTVQGQEPQKKTLNGQKINICIGIKLQLFSKHPVKQGRDHSLINIHTLARSSLHVIIRGEVGRDRGVQHMLIILTADNHKRLKFARNLSE